MQPKDLLVHLEKGNRTKEMLITSSPNGEYNQYYSSVELPSMDWGLMNQFVSQQIARPFTTTGQPYPYTIGGI